MGYDYPKVFFETFKKSKIRDALVLKYLRISLRCKSKNRQQILMRKSQRYLRLAGL